MLIYLLKSGACLAIFMAFYTFFLEKENMHVFKRYYLLGALIIAFIIPLVTFMKYIEVSPLPLVKESFETVIFYPKDIPKIEETNYLPIILWGIYALGALVFGSKFLMNLIQINFRIYRNPKQKSKHVVHVLLADLITPHTFFKYIFLNKQKYENHAIPQEVFWHEETHAKQKHSIDVLFIELLQVIFWFNPLIYFAKQSIKMNHEFLADQAVLNKGIVPSAYQHILLAFSSNASESPLANAINYSSTRQAVGMIKKRFTVMNTHTSKRKIGLKSLVLLPLLTLTLYGFSEKKEVVREIQQQNIKQNATIENQVATDEMMKEYKTYISNLDRKHLIIRQDKYNRIVAIYDLMSQEQKDSVEPYPKAPLINLSQIKANKPTQEQFSSWKNGKEFALWIDGKHINNSELNKYSVDDINHFNGSFVYENARSTNFPQPYQFNLYTKKGFEETFIKSHLNAYNQLIKTYSDALNEFQNSNRETSSELKIQKAELDRMYNEISTENRSRYGIPKAHPVPIEKNNSSKDKFQSHLGIQDEHTQQKATSEEIKEYNSLTKQFNSRPEGERIIRVKDKNRIEYIHSLMTDEQKKENESFPNFLTVAPPPIPYNASENLETYIIERNKVMAYIKKHKIDYPYGYVALSDSEQKEFMNLYNAMSSAFTNLSISEKQSAPKILPPPPSPKLYKSENGKLIKKQDIPPPPPPAPFEQQNPSKELLEARKKYDEKGNAYGEAMQVYFKEKKGNLDDLKKQYKEVMELYNSYEKLLDKEHVLPPPPPPIKN